MGRFPVRSGVVGQLFLSPRSLIPSIRPELRLLSQYLSQRIVGLFATGRPSLLSPSLCSHVSVCDLIRRCSCGRQCGEGQLQPAGHLPVLCLEISFLVYVCMFVYVERSISSVLLC